MSRVGAEVAVPRVARWLLATVLPRRHRQHWLGDLAEEYGTHVLPERGALGARVWYWRQVLGSLPAALRRRLGASQSLPPAIGHRGVPSAGPLEGLVHDLRSGVRGLRARPAFTVVAVATMALGIGANVAIFSVVNATVLRGLPYAEPEQLVRFWPDALFSVGVADVAALREASPDGLAIGAYGRSLLTFTGGGEPEMARGAVVTPDHFDLLGVRALHGRGFVPGEGEPGRDNVIVLEHGFWQRRFGGEVAVIGATVEIGGQPWLVAGVMPASHQPLEHDWTFWRPLDLDPGRDPGNALAAIGRLPAGMSREQAGSFYRDTLVERWSVPGQEPDPETLQAMVAGSLRDWLLGPWRARLLLLLGAVALVLLIACANVGNLMLARTVGRRDELSLRAALGAGRLRVLRLLLIEAVLVAVMGAAIGVLAAVGLVGAIRGSIPAGVPRLQQIAVDGDVLFYAVTLTGLSALAFGLFPALRGALRATALRGTRSTGGAGDSRLGRGFVAAQIAVAVLLVVGAGLLMRSFWRLQSVDPGFRAEGVVALRPAPPSSLYPDEADVRAYHSRLGEALRQIPGVRAVGGIMFLPMHPGGWFASYRVTDRRDGGEGTGNVGGRVVTPDYFVAMEVPLLSGRAFGPDDDDAGEPVVVVNEALAREAWPGEDAVGKTLGLGEDGTRRVVGVVGDVRQQALATPGTPEIYLPYAQQMWRNMYFTVRVDGDAADFVPRIRDTVRGVDARVPVNNLVPMPQVVADTAAGSRFLAGFVIAFGVVAMTLGMIGVYGVTAYSVARRSRELGIRMAMGAPRGQVMWQTLLAGARPVAIGLVLGLLAAIGASRALQGLLYEVEPLDPMTFAAVPVLLVAAALVALWIPARRATLVDPATVLRE